MLTTIEDVKNFVLNWNIQNPIDRWWREKHNISFNSSDHRDSCFIDQMIEYEEDRLFRQLVKEKIDEQVEDGEDKPNNNYVAGKGNFLINRKLTQQETDDVFSNIDLDNFNLE